MSEQQPKHRDMSGYINGMGEWVHSAWDARIHDWRDLGTDREKAEAAAKAWPDVEEP